MSEKIRESILSRNFMQIPGPNPIVAVGGQGAWDERCIESCDIFFVENLSEEHDIKDVQVIATLGSQG